MRKLIFPILLTVLFAAHHAFAQIPSCPCDTIELPSGISGDEIVDILCPDGNLSPGNESFVTPDLVEIQGPGDGEPIVGYQVLFENGLKGCGIFDTNISTLPIQLTDEEYEDCRQRLIQGCNLNRTTNIPTLSEWGMIAMAGVLGMIGLYAASHRRKATA